MDINMDKFNKRYNRNIPTVSDKLKTIKVAVVGLGGFGGLTAEYLLRSGFENLTLFDNDVFEDSNLNRQVGATEDTIGKSKSESLAKRLKSINSNATIRFTNTFITEETKHNLLDFELVILNFNGLTFKLQTANYIASHGIPVVASAGNFNETKVISLLDPDDSIYEFYRWEHEWKYIQPYVCLSTAGLAVKKALDLITEGKASKTHLVM